MREERKGEGRGEERKVRRKGKGEKGRKTVGSVRRRKGRRRGGREWREKGGEEREEEVATESTVFLPPAQFSTPRTISLGELYKLFMSQNSNC